MRKKRREKMRVFEFGVLEESVQWRGFNTQATRATMGAESSSGYSEN